MAKKKSKKKETSKHTAKHTSRHATAHKHATKNHASAKSHRHTHHAKTKQSGGKGRSQSRHTSHSAKGHNKTQRARGKKHTARKHKAYKPKVSRSEIATFRSTNPGFTGKQAERVLRSEKISQHKLSIRQKRDKKKANKIWNEGMQKAKAAGRKAYINARKHGQSKFVANIAAEDRASDVAEKYANKHYKGRFNQTGRTFKDRATEADFSKPSRHKSRTHKKTSSKSQKLQRARSKTITKAIAHNKSLKKLNIRLSHSKSKKQTKKIREQIARKKRNIRKSVGDAFDKKHKLGKYKKKNHPGKSTTHKTHPGKSTTHKTHPSRSTTHKTHPSRSTTHKTHPSRSTTHKTHPGKSTTHKTHPGKSTTHKTHPGKSTKTASRGWHRKSAVAAVSGAVAGASVASHAGIAKAASHGKRHGKYVRSHVRRTKGHAGKASAGASYRGGLSKSSVKSTNGKSRRKSTAKSASLSVGSTGASGASNGRVDQSPGFASTTVDPGLMNNGFSQGTINSIERAAGTGIYTLGDTGTVSTGRTNSHLSNGYTGVSNGRAVLGQGSYSTGYPTMSTGAMSQYPATSGVMNGTISLEMLQQEIQIVQKEISQIVQFLQTRQVSYTPTPQYNSTPSYGIPIGQQNQNIIHDVTEGLNTNSHGISKDKEAVQDKPKNQVTMDDVLVASNKGDNSLQQLANSGKSGLLTNAPQAQSSTQIQLGQ